MKNLCVLASVMFIMTLLAISCTKNNGATYLFTQVENLIDEYPDSALFMLDSARNNKQTFGKVQQIRYEFLYAKAQNKAYVDFTTDSIMLEVAAYYDAHGTSNEQMEANYLLGCTYRDMHESPMALSCYLDAVEKADTLSKECDYRVLMRIWGQIADEFDRQGMPLDELKALSNYQKYAKICGNIFNYIVGVEIEMRPYLQLKDTASAIASLENAYELFRSNNFGSDAARTVANLIPILLDKGKIEEAKKQIDYFESTSGLFNKNGDINELYVRYYSNKGKYYLCINKLDSAEFYYRKLQAHKYYLDAYKGLLNVYKKKGTTDSICKYAICEEEAFVDNYSKLHTQAIFNIKGMFDYTRNQRIAEEKQKETKCILNKAIFVGLLVLCLMIITFIHFWKFKKIKKRELEALSLQYREAKNRHDKAIEEFALMEKDFEVYKAMKAMEIEHLEASSQQASITYERNNRRDILTSLCSHEIVKQILENEKIGHNHHSEISFSQWSALYKLFEKEVPQLYSAYINNQHLSDRERKTLVLTCLGVNTKNIAVLLNTTAPNISNIKTSTNQKLFSDSSAKTLYDNIMFA